VSRIWWEELWFMEKHDDTLYKRKWLGVLENCSEWSYQNFGWNNWRRILWEKVRGLYRGRLQEGWKEFKSDKSTTNGMTSTEFDRFSSCTSAKEIWDGLELAYEGTSIVKKNRIDLLIQKYELFSMEPNESLDSMSPRFLSIINELKI